MFPSIYSQNHSLSTLLLYTFTYTSDFMRAIPHHLCKRVNLGLQIINLLGVTRMFQVKPLSWQTSLCDRIIHTLAATYMIDYYLSTINSTESLEYFESRRNGQEEQPCIRGRLGQGRGGQEEQPHFQGTVAAQVQEGLEEQSHVEGQEGQR